MRASGCPLKNLSSTAENTGSSGAAAAKSVIEHNLHVIKVADHIIDLGPEGGDAGGSIVFTGTPEDCARCAESYTGQFLKKELEG